MPFSDAERALLLAIRGVGPKVLERLDQLGVAGLDDLATRDPAALCAAVAAMLRSPCWRNSPHARSAIAEAVAVARRRRGR